MTIASLKDLKALVQLCRKLGVDKISVDNVEISLGTQPSAPKRRQRSMPIYGQPGVADPIDTPDTLSEEDLLFYSVNDRADQ